ncbi:hypothetical protein QYH69_08400 [Paraburkholderia sp. SARCC-3016]|uniref:hypothetical protein n=1 Tax=Paraburkholderia sp. SARCC-3016 TaxID=3058611 RepID=UPI0028066BFD|nr:hypothetical protein [Paraburkholderia sp. SARCC-3016]MDQ7977266.1 hypothetical protein [Paraburkholderia sp. SARCC-3016]
MQISDNAAVPGSIDAPLGAPDRNERSSFQDLLSQLNAYAGSNPGQGLFNSILAQLGITPQQFAQMTPAEREKIEEKIRELMKKEMQAQRDQQQDPSMQLIQMQQQGLQAGMQSDTSSSHKHGANDVAL